MTTWITIGTGAALGAWLRWGLGRWLNPLFSTIPLGTLAANLLGGLLMGVAMQYFLTRTGFSPAVRLGLTTGFLGGLTTFSTFSAETTTLLLRGDYGWTLALISAHVIGSVSMTIVGLWLVRTCLSGHG